MEGIVAKDVSLRYSQKEEEGLIKKGGKKKRAVYRAHHSADVHPRQTTQRERETGSGEEDADQVLVEDPARSTN